MASAIHAAPRVPAMKLDDNVPVIFAPKFVTGRDCGPSSFPPYLPRVKFTAMHTGAPLFLDAEDGSDLERGMRDLGIQPGDFIRVTRVRHHSITEGGGFSIRVERVEDKSETREPEPQRRGPSREEALLEKSLEMARSHGTAAFTAREPREPPARERAAPERTARTHGSNTDSGHSHVPIITEPASGKGTMSSLVAGALCASIDAYLLAAEYAKSKGIAVEMRLVFDGEDIRTSANSMCMEYWKSGGTR